MALGAAYEDDAIQALANSPVVAKPAAEPKFSAWQMATAVPRGVNEALVQVAATGADVLGSIRSTALASPEQRRQMARTGAPIDSYSSEAGDELRKFGREFRPDPQTAHAAEQVVYGFSRGATKVIGGALAAGPLGVVAAGAEEAVTQADELRLQGVDYNTRVKAGAVQGAGLAIAALPVIGQTKLATAGLYAIGGPGGFIAQQALTREILQGAGYDKIGEQFDPFDPVGLAVATLLPAGFAAYGLRQQKLQRAAASLPDLPPRADAVPPAEPAAPVPIPSRLSPITEAVRAYPTEAVDAARVVLLAERRAAANPGRDDDIKAMDQHEAALSRAEDQIAAGEAVQVADVAPSARVPVVETPEFRAWFRESMVATEAGQPQVVYRGGATENWRDGVPFNEFNSPNGPWAGFFTSDPAVASRFAEAQLPLTVRGGAPAGVFPVYLRMERPLVVDAQGRPARDFQIDASMLDKADSPLRAQLTSGEYDGLILRNTSDEGDVFVPLRSEQIKSAIGNSGRFDPTTGSLTDSPYATWADQITAAIREMQAQARPTDAPTTPQAANPEAAAPARGAGEPPAAAGAADAGRPAGVEAAGLSPEVAAMLEAVSLNARAPKRIAEMIGGMVDTVNAMGDSRQMGMFGDAPTGADAVAGAAERAVMDSGLSMAAEKFPALEVMVDGMEKPMPMAEFLAAAKAEADDLAADAPLMQIAAECALLNGPG